MGAEIREKNSSEGSSVTRRQKVSHILTQYVWGKKNQGPFSNQKQEWERVRHGQEDCGWKCACMHVEIRQRKCFASMWAKWFLQIHTKADCGLKISKMRGTLAYSVKPLAALITCHVQLCDPVLNGLVSAFSLPPHVCMNRFWICPSHPPAHSSLRFVMLA